MATVILLLVLIVLIVAFAVWSENNDGRTKNKTGRCNFDGLCKNCSVDEGYLSWQIARMHDSLRIARTKGYEHMFNQAQFGGSI